MLGTHLPNLLLQDWVGGAPTCALARGSFRLPKSINSGKPHHPHSWASRRPLTFPLADVMAPGGWGPAAKSPNKVGGATKRNLINRRQRGTGMGCQEPGRPEIRGPDLAGRRKEDHFPARSCPFHRPGGCRAQWEGDPRVASPQTRPSSPAQLFPHLVVVLHIFLPESGHGGRGPRSQGIPWRKKQGKEVGVKVES